MRRCPGFAIGAEPSNGNPEACASKWRTLEPSGPAGSSWETRYAYSRAVVAGGRVYVSGTAPIMPDDADPPAGPYAQARRCFDIIERALVEAGAGVPDVVRTRVFVTDPSHMSEVMTAHKDVFGDVRPASTGVVVQLVDPRWLVEIDVEAILPA